MSVRAMLARVQRLEQARRPTSPFEIWFGSVDAWEAECQSGIDAGLLDRTDVPFVMMAVRRWHSEGAWR
jgi:hypothetical protein